MDLFCLYVWLPEIQRLALSSHSKKGPGFKSASWLGPFCTFAWISLPRVLQQFKYIPVKLTDGKVRVYGYLSSMLALWEIGHQTTNTFLMCVNFLSYIFSSLIILFLTQNSCYCWVGGNLLVDASQVLSDYKIIWILFIVGLLKASCTIFSHLIWADVKA